MQKNKNALSVCMLTSELTGYKLADLLVHTNKVDTNKR